MQRLVHIMLALLVTACPLGCTVFSCDCCAVETVATASATDCGCCDKDTPPPAPVSPPASPTTKCLCSGAILAVNYQPETEEPQVTFLSPTECRLTTVAPSIRQVQFQLEADIPPPFGRMLRQLNMSLTL